MKHLVIFFVLLSLGFSVFAEPSRNDIEQCARILGVPFNDLETFVRSYYTPTNFSSSNANNAVVISSLQELEFLRQTNGLKVGTYYIIRGKFIGQNGKTIQINDNDFNGTSGQYWIFFDVDYMVRFSRNTVLNVLLTINQNSYGSIQYVCVEIIEEH
jgi:hypothetical protein